MISTFIIVIYHQIKALINFFYKRKLNFRSFIQLSEILSVKLTETHTIFQFLN